MPTSWEMLGALVALIALVAGGVATTIKGAIASAKNEMLDEFRKTEKSIAEVREQFGVPLAAMREKVELLFSLREKVESIPALRERVDNVQAYVSDGFHRHEHELRRVNDELEKHAARINDCERVTR